MGTQTFYGQLKSQWIDTTRGNETSETLVGLSQGQKLSSPLTLRPEDFEQSKMVLQNRDRMTVFNTINDGDVFWEGRLKADDIAQNFPAYKNFSTLLEDRVFMRLCHQDLPATLEKTDGRIIHGVMHAFMEQGSGSSPYLYDFADKGYGSLNQFEDGDLLRVFSRVTDGQILWRGPLKADNEPVSTGRKVQYRQLGSERIEKEIDEFKQKVEAPPAELFDRWKIVGYPVMLERDI